jgi:hypothetical protein
MDEVNGLLGNDKKFFALWATVPGTRIGTWGTGR